MGDRLSPQSQGGADFPPPREDRGSVAGGGRGSEAGGRDADGPDRQRLGNDPRTKEEIEQDDALALRLSGIIEHANKQVVPICNMIRKHIETFEAQKEEDRDQQKLMEQVKPLLEQATKILNETNGAVHGADPDQKLTNRAQRNMADHRATPAEQRLAEALKVMIEHVQGTIEWAKAKIESFPGLKRDLGPLFDALGQPLTQIVGGVALLLTGVLNLVGKLLSGLGLDSLLKGIVAATGIDKIYKGLGLDKWLKTG